MEGLADCGVVMGEGDPCSTEYSEMIEIGSLERGIVTTTGEVDGEPAAPGAIQ